MYDQSDFLYWLEFQPINLAIRVIANQNPAIEFQY